MNSLSQQQLVIVIRSLSFYLADLLKHGDIDNSQAVVKMLDEASHNLKG